ncbi:putative multidrug resistance protein MdtD [subsurface metagenome]
MATVTLTTTTALEPSIHSRSSHSVDPVHSAHTLRQQQQRQQDVATVSHPISPEDDTVSPPSTDPKPFKPTRRFWLVMMSVGAISMCGSIEATIVINALPTITAALGGGKLYLWVPNAFYLASLAVLPFYAQVSDIFGRRTMLLIAVALFVLGCALGGASTSMTMLIVARTTQGVGGGGIDTLTETIILDLVPLRERGKYMAIVSIGTALDFAVGPFVGGLIVVKLGWPWIFYINAIISGVALVMFFFFLRVKHQRGQTLWSKVKRIDFGGNAIFIGAVIAVLLALTWAGPVYHWDSARILVPLILGLLGLCIFTAFEWTPRLAPEPSFPRALVSNRTSSAALAMTVVNCITATGTFYFLPVYFQGVLAKSPLDSGIAVAPIATTLLPFCIIFGTMLSKVGKYRPLHLLGWVLTLISAGLFCTLNRHSSTAAWASFELLGAVGIAALTVSLLPAMQAPLPERYAATSAGMYSFARSFGSIWGVTIPAAVFNNAVKQQVRADQLIVAMNSTLADNLANGQAYQLATKAFLDTLSSSGDIIREQVIGIFEHAIHVVFYVLTAFAGLGLCLVFLEKEIPMRTEIKTEFGLDEGGETREAHPGHREADAGQKTAAVGGSQYRDGFSVDSRNVDAIELRDMSNVSR